MYGSTVYGICTNDTSCDIDIDFEKTNKSNMQILKDVQELVKKHMCDVFDLNQPSQLNGNGKSARSNSNNSSNKITFDTKKLKISFNFTSGLFSGAYKTSQLIKAYLELDERAKVLAFCFRHMAKVKT